MDSKISTAKKDIILPIAIGVLLTGLITFSIFSNVLLRKPDPDIVLPQHHSEDDSLIENQTSTETVLKEKAPIAPGASAKTAPTPPMTKTPTRSSETSTPSASSTVKNSGGATQAATSTSSLSASPSPNTGSSASTSSTPIGSSTSTQSNQSASSTSTQSISTSSTSSSGIQTSTLCNSGNNMIEGGSFSSPVTSQFQDIALIPNKKYTIYFEFFSVSEPLVFRYNSTSTLPATGKWISHTFLSVSVAHSPLRIQFLDEKRYEHDSA